MPEVELHINKNEFHSGYYDVVVSGSGFHEQENRTVGARVMGDDWIDDWLFGLGFGFTRVGRDGNFSLYRFVHGSVLDEDPFWGDRDEIYAVVGVDGLNGEFKTNTVKRHF